MIFGLLKGVWSTINFTDLLSQVLSSLIAATLFWILIESRIKKFVESKERIQLSRMFLEQVIYNRIVAVKIVEKKDSYLSGKNYTFLKYETSDIDKFLATEPLNLDIKFYANTRVVNAALKKDNMLIDIFWFSPQLTQEDRKINKETLIANASICVENMDKILNDKDFVTKMKKQGLTKASLYK